MSRSVINKQKNSSNHLSQMESSHSYQLDLSNNWTYPFPFSGLFWWLPVFFIFIQTLIEYSVSNSQQFFSPVHIEPVLSEA